MMNGKIRIAGAALVLAALQGCATLGASFAVSDGSLIPRTESAIGLPSSEFTISDRVNEGVTARYKVRTRSGKTYNCFVGGSLIGTGKSVSEAVCSPLDGSAPAERPGTPCDALSRAAKRC